MPIRPRALAVIGAPLAGWALFGCLTLAEVGTESAGALAVLWSVFWVAAGWLGTRRGGLTASLRGGAIVTSLLLPVPTYLLTLGAAWLALVPSAVGLPMFAILCSSAPLFFWSLTVKSKRRQRNSGPMMVMDWHHYDSQAPAGSIPPRNSSMRRAI